MILTNSGFFALLNEGEINLWVEESGHKKCN